MIANSKQIKMYNIMQSSYDERMENDAFVRKQLQYHASRLLNLYTRPVIYLTRVMVPILERKVVLVLPSNFLGGNMHHDNLCRRLDQPFFVTLRILHSGLNRKHHSVSVHPTL